MAKQTFEMTFAGRPLVVEVGQVAKQANGAVVVRYGDTTVLSTAVMSKKMATADFFPLQVNYEEKMYAAGKFPGGFNKREGRPSTDATLMLASLIVLFVLCLRRAFVTKFKSLTPSSLMMRMLVLRWRLCLVAL